MSEAENVAATGKTIKAKGNFENQPDGYEFVPILVEKSPECKLSSLEKKHFLVNSKLKIVQFQFKIKKMLNLPTETCLFLYTDNYTVWESSTTFEELYEHFKRKIVCMKYTDENLYVTEICNNLKENVDAAEPLP